MESKFKDWCDELFLDMCTSLQIPESIARMPIRVEPIARHLVANKYRYLFQGNCTVKRLKSKPSKVNHVNREYAAFCNSNLGTTWKPKNK